MLCFLNLVNLTKLFCITITQKLKDVTVYANKIQISPLKKIVPEGIEEFTRLVYDLLPRIKLTDLLVEVDNWTHFTKQFVHLHASTAPKDKSVLFVVIMADGINLGLRKMADWDVRDENYTKALGDIVNFHHKQPIATYWGVDAPKASGSLLHLSLSQGEI